MQMLAFALILVTVSAWPQCQEQQIDDLNRRTRSMCTLNPTNNVVPVRYGSTFADSRLSRDINGNLQIGMNPRPNILNGGLTMVGSLAKSNVLEVHNNYAVGVDLFTHANAGFRAPYINFYKSDGTQLAPAPILYSGVYEADSIGGINFGGWDGSAYFAGSAAIYTAPDENWTPTHHGGHLSIYGTNVGSLTQQIAQFGGKDSNGFGGDNVVFFRPLSFGGNQYNNPALYPESSGISGVPAILHVRGADNSRDASVTALNVSVSGFVAPGSVTVENLPAASETAGKMFVVSDSTAVIAEGQMCIGGGTGTALAFSNGTVWKCF